MGGEMFKIGDRYICQYQSFFSFYKFFLKVLRMGKYIHLKKLEILLL